MPDDGRYIAIDWGSTNRRAYLIGPHGETLDAFRDDRGVISMRREDYAAELTAIRERLGDLPVLAAGMVGSNRGWREASYVSAPADLSSLTAALVVLEDHNAAIVPGVALIKGPHPDVMRGEEVQALGAVAAELIPPDALVVQPGTHNKWIMLAEGRIADFTTTLTGELFALLKANGILAGMLDGIVSDGPAFRDGLVRGSETRNLAGSLFEVRAAVLLGARPADQAASFASGVLIGADVGAHDLDGRDVHLLASGELADIYAAAIEFRGGRAVRVDSHAAFRAGIHRIRELAL